MSKALNTPLEWIGKSIPKVEDRKFLLGRGGYVDDHDLPNLLHVAVVRSPFAHALIKSIDTSAALELEGVVALPDRVVVAQEPASGRR